MSDPTRGPRPGDHILTYGEVRALIASGRMKPSASWTAKYNTKSRGRTSASSTDSTYASSGVVSEAPLRSVQVSPKDGAVSQGTTPTLTGKVAEPVPGANYVFEFTVCKTTGLGVPCWDVDEDLVIDSGWVHSSSWKVPAGKLKSNETYYWSVSVGQLYNGEVTPYFGTIFNSVRAFATGSKLKPEAYSSTANLLSPEDASILTTRTPTLKASVVRPESGEKYQYKFHVESFDGAIKWESSWLNSPSITVPASALYWNKGYTWSVEMRTEYLIFLWGQQRTFYPIVPVSPDSQLTADRLAPTDHAVSIASGAFTSVATDAAVAASGGSFSVSRSYRSVDTGVRALGAGWTSIFDMSIFTPSGAAGPQVRFADGHVESFASNPNGVYGGAPGNLRTRLTKCNTCSSWTLADGSGYIYTLDTKGVLSIKNDAGLELKVTRDSSGRPTVLKDAHSPRGLAITWSGTHITAIAATPAPSGVTAVWTYTYNGDKLTKACVPNRGTTVRCTTYEYQNAALPNVITKITNPSGVARANIAYTTGGITTSVMDSASSVWNYSRAKVTGGTAVTVTAPGSRKTVYSIDASFRIIRKVDALGGVQAWLYDAIGRLARYTDPSGGAIGLVYDGEGRISKRSVWRTPTTFFTQSFSYVSSTDASDGRLRSILDPRDSTNALATYTYDTLGRVTQEASASGPGTIATKFTYTAGTETAVGGGVVPPGLLGSVTEPTGGVTRYAYGSDGLLRTTTTPSGLVTTYSYDSLGRLTASSATVDGVARTTQFAWFDDGTPASETQPRVDDGVSGVTRQDSTSVSLDVDSRPTAVTVSDLVSGATSTTTTEYDALGRATKIVGPDGSTQAEYTYDADGNVLTAKDARGSVTRATYDATGHLLRVVKLAYRDPNHPDVAPRDVTVAAYTWDPSGRTSTVTDANGATHKYGYTLEGLVSSVVVRATLNGPDLPEAAIVYDAMGNPISGEQNTTGPWTKTYDAAGRLASTVYAGSTTTYTYDSAGRPLRVSLSGSVGVESYQRAEYDSAGHAKLVAWGRTSDDRIVRYAYNTAGEITGVTDPRATTTGEAAWTTNYTYDPTGKLVRVTSPRVSVRDASGTSEARPVVATGYDALGRPVKQVDAKGAISSVLYDAAGRVIKYTAPTVTLAGGPTQPTFSRTINAAGDVTTSTNPDGLVTKYSYDSWGRLVARTDPAAVPGGLARISSWEWSDSGIRLAAVDASGRKTSQSINSLGQVTTTSVYAGPSAQTTTYTYNQRGQVEKIIDPLNAMTTLTYDIVGQLIGVRDADGVTNAFGYDPAGHRTRSTGGGRTTITEYDSVGNPVKTTHESSSGTVLDTSVAAYDPAGNRISATGPMGTGSTSSWDALNRQLTLSDTDGTTTRMGYDATGLLTSITDARDNTTSLSRNLLGEVTSIVEPATAAFPTLSDRTWTMDYDMMGNPVRTVAPGGVTTTRTFDADGNTLTESATGAGIPSANRTFTYDPTGLLTSEATPTGKQSFSYDTRGLLTSSSGPLGSSSHVYDAAGRLTSSTDASGTTASSWTPAGRVASVTTGAGVQTFDYSSDGELSKVKLPGAVRTFSRDGSGRVVGDVVTNAQASVVYSWNGTYDAAGRLISEQIGPSTMAGSGATTYTYNPNSELTAWVDPSGVHHSRTYDEVGNLSSEDGVDYTYDQRNRLLTKGDTTYAYSARGTRQSQTTSGIQTSLAWDALDRLVAAGTKTYTYDSLDRIASANNSPFSYSGSELEPASDGQTSWSRLGSTPLTADGKYLISDQHDNVRATIAGGSVTSNANWSPSGTLSSGTVASAIGFQGQWSNGTFVHMQSRWYDSATSSFMSRDTATVPVNQVNRYQYALGNPITHTDPTGQWCTDVPSCVAELGFEAGTIVGGVISGTGTGTEVGAVGGTFVEPGGGTLVGGGLGGLIGGAIGFGIGLWIVSSNLNQPAELPLLGGGTVLPKSGAGTDTTVPSVVDWTKTLDSWLTTQAAGIEIEIQKAIDGVGGAIATANNALAVADKAMAGLNKAVAEANRILTQMSSMLAGANWADTPDHSEKLITRPADLAKPIGVLPVDAPRLCGISSAVCQGTALDAAGLDLASPPDLITSFTPRASLPEDPTPEPGARPGDPDQPNVPATAADPSIPAGSTSETETSGSRITSAVRKKYFVEGAKPDTCSYCQQNPAEHLDHVIPRSKKGDLSPANLTPACSWCNLSKGARPAPVNPPPDYTGEWPPSFWPTRMLDWWRSAYGGEGGRK
ncbi:MAG: RHS repeat-associated core domain-containing protein [Micropruina sp.]|uniref:RHS repeat-associated core domain-containing protein n=1 Tax=Micropruina sp. TaxID=2737536 RepID=UPI0039E5676A